MVLARDLHEKIQDMQIKIEGSKRIAHLENEITTLTDAVHLLVSKLEKPIEEENTPDPYKDETGKTKKIKREAIPKDNNEEDEEEPEVDEVDEVDEDDEDEEEPEVDEVDEDDEDEEEPEVDEDEDEEDEEEPEVDEDDEDEEEPEVDEYEEDEDEEYPEEDPELANQEVEKKELKELSGYKEDKEKIIHGIAHDWTERDDILSDNFTVIAKRIIFYKNKGYEHLKHIEYLDIRCKNKLKYITLTNLLQLILSITNKRWNLEKSIEFSICNAKYEFNNKSKYLVHNLVEFFKKVSRLKDSRFSE